MEGSLNAEWNRLPKKLAIDNQGVGHVYTIASYYYSLLCGAGMGKHGQYTDFVFEAVDCKKCKSYLSLNPRNILTVGSRSLHSTCKFAVGKWNREGHVSESYRNTKTIGNNWFYWTCMRGGVAHTHSGSFREDLSW